jgi:translocation and assembly module TamB
MVPRPFGSLRRWRNRRDGVEEGLSGKGKPVMRRVPRWLVMVLATAVAVLLVAGVVILGVRSYLHSPEAAARAARALEQAYGGPVQVGSVDVGPNGTALHGLKLYEPGSPPDALPWADIRDVQADVTAWDLTGGAPAPRHIDVTGADLTLHFDRAGHLVTHLPRKEGPVSLPEIEVHQGRLTIVQEGRPEFVVEGIEARVQSSDGRAVLTGTVSDPRWGDWTADGMQDPQAGSASLMLKTAHEVQATQEMLEALPFVGPNVWKQLQADGDTTVVLRLDLKPAGQGVHYRVELAAENTKVHVTAIDLDADQAHGTVIVEDGVVTLEKVQGHTADGELSTNATLDFHVTPNVLTFALDAEGLDLKQLPRKWNLRREVEGKLSGHADLVVTVSDGKAHPTGDGYGEITDARVVGLQAKPIHLKLHADGTGFRFLPRWPTSAKGHGNVPGLTDLGAALFGP